MVVVGRFLEPVVALLLHAVVTVSIVVLLRKGVSRTARSVSLVALLACLPVSVDRGEHRCRECGSGEHALRFGWGIQDDWVVLADCGEVLPSQACRDLFDPGHRHRWIGTGQAGGAFLYNSPLTRWSLYSGSVLPNPFARRYEESASFRDEVKERIGTGETTREEVRRLVSLGSWPDRTPSLPKGTHALILRAAGWLGEPIWPEDRRKDWPPERGT